MKNKNFTSRLNVMVSKTYLAFAFLFVFFAMQNVMAQTPDCPLSSNNLVQVSIDNTCTSLVTPEMIIEGETDGFPCNYTINSIVDANGAIVGHPEAGSTGNWILDGDDAYQVLTAEVGFNPSIGNVTWGKLYLEDKIAPTLRCLDTVYVSCSEDLSDYLTTSTIQSYVYDNSLEVVPSVGANMIGVPFNISAGGYVDIPFEVDNEANQSEIMKYVEAVLNLSTNSNVTVQFKEASVIPFAGAVNLVNNKWIDYHYYTTQATDPVLNGTWQMRVINGNAFPVTVNNAELKIVSESFLNIGDGVIVNDNCFTDQTTLEILSDFTRPNDDMCGDWFRERKIKYQGTDWRGMKTPVCEHVIRWEHKGLSDMEWPTNYDGLAGSEPPLSCSGEFMEADLSGDFTENGNVWDANGDGYPQPGEVDVPSIDGNPIYPDPAYCMINVTYSDEKFDECPGSYKLLRKWIAYDMCEPGQNGVNPSTHYQIIKVIDNTPLVLFSHVLQTITVSANAFECYADDIVLPLPHIVDYGCSEGYTYEVGYCATGNGIFEYFNNITSKVVKDPYGDLHLNTREYTIDGLPVGETCVRYIITDECGNITYATLTVIVEDDVAPIPICDEHTVVTVSSDCTARIKAKTFDDGSFDNCTAVDFTVARMSGNSVGVFRDYVDFSGSDVGNTRQVVLKVTDKNENENTCMVFVTIDNKFPLTISCPDNVYVDCGTDLNALNLGTATVIYNCSSTLTEGGINSSLNNCGVTDGAHKVTKIWTAKAGGITKECTQYIYVSNNTPFTMINAKQPYGHWPKDVTNLVGCSDAETDPSETGEPNLSHDDACSMVASTHKDRVFNVVEDACYKILRDWTVIDWCNYNDSNPVPVYGQPGHPYVGMWTHTQVIMVNDNNAPVITTSCATQTICAYNANCTGDITLVAEADDTCTPDSELVWTYRVEKGNAYFASGNKNKFTKNEMALGTYKMFWTVEDKCGNIDECNYTFIVKDCKKPTPLCYSEITTVVMPTTDPRMVVVKARDFDRGSSDNCTEGATCGDCATDLHFSFDSLGNQTQNTFTEAHVGLQTLKMWVRDAAGNRDFCTVTLHVQDNVVGGALVAGSLITEDEKELEHAAIEIEDMVAHETLSTVSNANGFFQFNVDGNTDYQLNAEMDDKYLNGLTTLDIVIIQKHLLSIRMMNSPYKILAADANQDKKITASDILVLRKLILGSESKLSNTKAWSFIDGATQFEKSRNPWFGNENMNAINLENVLEDNITNKFIGLKIGDVNNSVVLNSSVNLEPRGIVSLDIDNVEYNTGDVVKVPVYANGLDNVIGLQFGIKFNNDNLEVVNVEAGKMSIAANNYSIKDGVLYMSWNSNKGNTYNEDEILFTIDFAARNTGQLINQIGITNTISPEAYNSDLDVYGIELNYRNSGQGEFALYQNTPNPFSNETEITFEIPEAGIVTTTVYDVTGKVIALESSDFEKGRNSVKMSRNDLNNISGVLYYKVEFNGNVAIKKMILLTK